MANRSIRRKQKIEDYKTNNIEELDIKDYITVIVAIGIVVVVAYGLTLLAQHMGLFNERYIKPEVAVASISYENILAGTIFNRAESEYYVMLGDFDKDDSIYMSSLGLLYKEKEGDKLPLYAVDLSESLNKTVVSDSSNPTAQTVADLKINGHTLIKISNGRNIKYIEGDDNIKTELGV